jgi:hypothetical protein
MRKFFTFLCSWLFSIRAQADACAKSALVEGYACAKTGLSLHWLKDMLAPKPGLRERWGTPCANSGHVFQLL